MRKLLFMVVMASVLVFAFATQAFALPSILSTLTPDALYSVATADIINMVWVPMFLVLGLGFAAAVVLLIFRFGGKVNARIRRIGS